MKQPWVFWIVFVLIVGSVAYELFTGTARVRGIGSYSRNEAPRAYWLVIVLKGILAALIAAIAIVFRT